MPKLLQNLSVHAPLEREELYFNGLSFSLSVIQGGLDFEAEGYGAGNPRPFFRDFEK